jgi:membrane protein
MTGACPTRFTLPERIRNNLLLLWQALKKFNGDDGFFLSSGIAFNVLINLIPFVVLLLAVVGVYLYSDQEVLAHMRAYLRNAVPAMDPKIMGSLMDVIQKRQAMGILGFAGLIWFSTWVFKSLRIALNTVFQVGKPRGILRALGVDLLMVGVVGILFLVNIILSSFVVMLKGYEGWIPVTMGPTIQWMLKYLLPFVFAYCMFFLIYKVMPNKTVHSESALKAAFFAGLLWELAKHLFAWYVAHIAVYSIFYGSLSTLVVFVLWVYYSSTILVVGGELAYVLEKERVERERVLKPDS